jgi:hyperosmotically inducible periplasmic protein
MTPSLLSRCAETRSAGPRARAASRARLGGLAAVAAAALVGLAGCGIFRGHESPSAYVDDSALTARVKTALIKDPKVKASEVDVHTYQGKVTLAGVVDNAAMMRRAEQIARDTPGVKSVESTIQVANASASDSEPSRR